MTLYKKHDGRILDREDYTLETYYELEDGTQIHEEDVEYVFECDYCGEMKEYSEVTSIGGGMSGHVCREHIDEEVIEAAEGEDN